MLDFELPDIDFKVPDIELALVSDIDFKMPELDIELPELQPSDWPPLFTAEG